LGLAIVVALTAGATWLFLERQRRRNFDAWFVEYNRILDEEKKDR